MEIGVVNQMADKVMKLFYGAPLVCPVALALLLGIVGLCSYLFFKMDDAVYAFLNAACLVLILASEMSFTEGL